MARLKLNRRKSRRYIHLPNFKASHDQINRPFLIEYETQEKDGQAETETNFYDEIEWLVKKKFGR